MSASSCDALLSNPLVRNAATRLSEAMQRRVACDPVKPLLNDLGLPAAYAVQSLLTQLAEKDGRRIVGRKIGLTSTAVQQQLGVDQPDFGMLFDDMAYGDAQEVPISRLLQPKRSKKLR